MLLNAKCKKCRRVKQKLFLKGERCFTPKCAMVKTPYPPGIHGAKRRRETSEYGRQLIEKQKIRITYGVLEKQFKKYILAAMEERGDNRENLIRKLEMRLDNVVYRLGLTKSRLTAKQIVGHGHILINNHKVDIPSYHVRVGDLIFIREKSKKLVLFDNLKVSLKKYESPSWLSLNKEKLEGEIIAQPTVDDVKDLTGIGMVIEYYSR